jgi:hypothetical protein
MIAPNAGLSVIRQCRLLGIARSSFHYQPRPQSADALADLAIPGTVIEVAKKLTTPFGGAVDAID